MLENILVMLIVAGSAWYAGSKYLPASWRARLGGQRAAAADCGSGGCSSCKGCADAAPAATGIEQASGQRVIRLQRH